MEMDGSILEEAEEKCEVLLGCNIQANLKWKNQVFMLSGKLRNRLVGLTKLKSFAPYSVRKTLAEGRFLIAVLYTVFLCLVAWIQVT